MKQMEELLNENSFLIRRVIFVFVFDFVELLAVWGLNLRSESKVLIFFWLALKSNQSEFFFWQNCLIRNFTNQL